MHKVKRKESAVKAARKDGGINSKVFKRKLPVKVEYSLIEFEMTLTPLL
ncbi:MAG: hypothetical protein AAF600_04060 [Bacteroidota bacterium]